MPILPATDVHQPLNRNLTDVRIDSLRNVIAWSLEKGSLSAGQRTLMHQEIASLLAWNEAYDTMDESLPRMYRIPAELDEKVQHIQAVICTTGWEKTEFKY